MSPPTRPPSGLESHLQPIPRGSFIFASRDVATESETHTGTIEVVLVRSFGLLQGGFVSPGRPGAEITCTLRLPGASCSGIFLRRFGGGDPGVKMNSIRQVPSRVKNKMTETSLGEERDRFDKQQVSGRYKGWIVPVLYQYSVLQVRTFVLGLGHNYTAVELSIRINIVLTSLGFAP